MVKIDKHKTMAALYGCGITLQEIGNKYGLTRERVRQILKRIGVNSKNGGSHFRSVLKKKEKKEIYLNSYMPWWGCTKKKYLETIPNIRKAYRKQKINSFYRGIPFKFSLPEWWNIWKQSGHWSDRGVNSDGYVMARKLDCGAYEVGNVEIITSQQNHKNAWKYKKWDTWINHTIKEFCKHGHKKEGIKKSGYRYCKECEKVSQIKHRNKMLLTG